MEKASRESVFHMCPGTNANAAKGGGAMSFDVKRFNDARFEESWNSLNEQLRKIHQAEGLSGALSALHQQQFDQGFIQDDLSSVIRCRLRHPSQRRAFSVQYNPRRAVRLVGAGRKMPPPGRQIANGGCFLCRENVRWQQRGIEIGYEIEIGETGYILLMNPFPLMPLHTTVVKKTHQPQSWIAGTPQESNQRIQSILSDLLDITGMLPGFVGFYNGAGAGATIPHHFHFQFFKRPEGQEPFALEQAAAHTEAPFVIGEDEYPITTIYFRGSKGEIVEQAKGWVYAWTEFYENHPALSANIIATVDLEHDQHFRLYFVPRNVYFSHAPGMLGLVGGLEVFGELVFSSEIEKQHLDTGRVDYDFVVNVLRAVEAPGVREFVRRPR